MQIDPRHLVQLAVIIDKASFTEAANALNMTQPALSKMVRALEQRIGGPLLSQRRPVVATPLGERLAEQGRIIEASLALASQSVADRRNGTINRLRIGGPPFFMESAAAEIIREFSPKFPAVAIELFSGYMDQVREMVLNRQLDLAMGPTNVSLNAPNLRTETVAAPGKALFCRAGHPLSSKPRVTAADLEVQGWIGHGRGSVIFREMSDDLFKIGVRNINLVIESASVSVLLMLLETTDYITYLPHFMMRDALRAGKITPLPVAGPFTETPFGFIFSDITANDPVALAFMQITGRYLQTAGSEVAARCKFA